MVLRFSTEYVLTESDMMMWRAEALSENTKRRTEGLPYGVRRHFPNRSLCVPVRDKVSTSLFISV